MGNAFFSYSLDSGLTHSTQRIQNIRPPQIQDITKKWIIETQTLLRRRNMNSQKVLGKSHQYLWPLDKLKLKKH